MNVDIIRVAGLILTALIGGLIGWKIADRKPKVENKLPLWLYNALKEEYPRWWTETPDSQEKTNENRT